MVAPDRLRPWLAGFVERNGELAEISAANGRTTLRTTSGGLAVIEQPSAASSIDELAAELLPAGRAVVVLIRRGGFAIAAAQLDGPTAHVVASKTGTRYVQGRTAAGGQSQQRFARRRAGQTDALVGAASAAARRVLGENPAPADLLVTGGDRPLIEQALSDVPLNRLKAARRRYVEVAEPRRATIDEALRAARSVAVEVTNVEEAS